MHGFSAAALLQTWEAGAPYGPLDRAITLLWAAGEEGDLAGLPLAERDRRLLALRQATFGESLNCLASCPDCGADVAFTLSAVELAQALVAPEPETVELAGVTLQLRALNSHDLAQAVMLPPGEIIPFLRSRVCPGVEALPPDAQDAVSQVDALIETREAAGELRLWLVCADCGATWQDDFDVTTHVWREVETAARRVLSEVAEMAAALGWSEAEILGLSEQRRRIYLTLARGG